MSQVPEGIYELVCLPLKIKGADGAPACAVSTYNLIKEANVSYASLQGEAPIHSDHLTGDHFCIW